MGYAHTNSRGVTYFLNTRKVKFNNGTEYPIYYFSRAEMPSACDMPEGYKVQENSRNGFLTLKKISKGVEAQ